MSVINHNFDGVEKKSVITTVISLMITSIVSAITIYYLFTDLNSAYNNLVIPVSSLLGGIFLTVNGLMKKVLF